LAIAAPALQQRPCCCPLATALLQLRVLRVQLAREMPIPGSDLRLLAGLVHQRQLRLCNYCYGSDARNANVVTMLGQMRHLRVLDMRFRWQELSSRALRVVGMSCPLLRRLQVLTRGDWFVGSTLEAEEAMSWDEVAAGAPQEPLLPNLKVLRVGPIDTWRYPNLR
jgi:hypothetical protein